MVGGARGRGGWGVGGLGGGGAGGWGCGRVKGRVALSCGVRARLWGGFRVGVGLVKGGRVLVLEPGAGVVFRGGGGGGHC